MTIPVVKTAAEAKAFVKLCVSFFGPSFHPDTAGRDYVAIDSDKPTFTYDDAKRFDRARAATFKLLGNDFYNLGYRLMQKASAK